MKTVMTSAQIIWYEIIDEGIYLHNNIIIFYIQLFTSSSTDI